MDFPGFIGRPGRPLQPTGETCTPITNQICQNISYSETSFPNMAVASSDEADLFLERISMFTGCHQQSQLFACSFVYPECTASIFGSRTSSIKACRSLCESVLERCGFVFSYLNFTTAVNCSHFTEEECTTQIDSGEFLISLYHCCISVCHGCSNVDTSSPLFIFKLIIIDKYDM